MSVPSNYKTVDWSSYEQLSADAPMAAVVALRGGDGSGKTHFALTAPGPIFVQATDCWGTRRVSPDVKRDKDIRISRYSFNPHQAGKTKNEIGAAATVVWDQFVADYRNVLQSKVRTIVWDREDLQWELMRYAAFGAQNDAPKEYGPLYIEVGSLISEAGAANVNLLILQGLRDKWESQFDPAKGKKVGINTGLRVPDGCNKIPDLVDITLDMRWDASQKQFMTLIDKFPNKDYRGEDVPGMDFGMMATTAYPETGLDDWGL